MVFSYTNGHEQWGLPVLIWYIRYEAGGAQNFSSFLCSIFKSKIYIKRLSGVDTSACHFYFKQGSLKLINGTDGPVGFLELAKNANMAKITSMNNGDSDTTGYTEVTVN